MLCRNIPQLGRGDCRANRRNSATLSATHHGTRAVIVAECSRSLTSPSSTMVHLLAGAANDYDCASEANELSGERAWLVDLINNHV
jgi:hypothetical protein